jgi:hypothetical protein
MIIGHIGVAFAARWRWPQVPLSWLVLATMAPDIVRVVLVGAGYETIPANVLSHGLPGSAILATAVALAAYLARRDPRTAAIMFCVVLSHVALDLISGRKALWAGGPSGLDIGHFEQLEFAIEGGLAWAGWRLMRRGIAPRWVASRGMLLLLMAIEAGFLVKSYEDRPWMTRCVTYPVSPCWSNL